MKAIYIVRAIWDGEASVWVATGFNFIGLATEAPTVEALLKKLPDMICDLIEADKEINSDDIPLQLLIEANTPIHCAQ